MTYRLEFDDRLIVVEHVPARVCLQYGETTYSPETVECLQRTVGMGRSPREYQMRLTSTDRFFSADSTIAATPSTWRSASSKPGIGPNPGMAGSFLRFRMTSK